MQDPCSHAEKSLVGWAWGRPKGQLGKGNLQRGTEVPITPSACLRSAHAMHPPMWAAVCPCHLQIA